MKVIFIADAHLTGLGDPAQRRLVEFLTTLADSDADRPDKVVLLGDIFDFWTGFKSVVYQRYVPVLSALLGLRARGVKLLYVEGNHDFLMGEFFTDVLGADVHGDNCRLSLEGKEVYLAHGDAVAMSLGYATWRAFLRGRIFRLLKKLTSPALVMSVAEMLSRRSRSYGKRAEALDRRLKEFARRRIMSGFDVVVLGHSHRPGVHVVGDETRGGVYANPGSWIDGYYLAYADGELKVERYGEGAEEGEG